MKIFCEKCQKEHESKIGWALSGNNFYCKEESTIGYPEFIPQYIKDERPKYLKSMIQSHRQGEFSKEFAESYPEKTKEMVKAGVVSEREVRKAKNVWRDLPNYHNLRKTL